MIKLDVISLTLMGELVRVMHTKKGKMQKKEQMQYNKTHKRKT